MRIHAGSRCVAWLLRWSAASTVGVMASYVLLSAIVPPQAVLLAQRSDNASQAGRKNDEANPLAFDVVSVKMNDSDSKDGGARVRPGGRLLVTNMTLRQMASYAFSVPPGLVLQGPAWADEVRFDIEAKTGRPDPSVQIVKQMTQSLLRDRFGLRFHQESRDLPSFELRLARQDRRLGPQMLEAKDCGSPPRQSTPESAPANSSPTNQRPVRASCDLAVTSGRWVGSDTMSGLAQLLSQVVGRPVIDRTGLIGQFRLQLAYSPFGADDPNGVPIETALREQLGLKLESSRTPTSVLIIDRAAKPQPN